MLEERLSSPFLQRAFHRASFVLITLLLIIVIGGGFAARSVIMAPKAQARPLYSSFVGSEMEGCTIGSVVINYGVGANNVVGEDGIGTDGYCWAGTGYLGLNPSIYMNNQVISCANAGYSACNGWYRVYYNGVGYYFSFGQGDLSQTDAKVTQICIQCGNPP